MALHKMQRSSKDATRPPIVRYSHIWLVLADLAALKGDSKELLAANLQKLLDQKGWSQAELARKLSVNPSQVTNWLKCKTFPRDSQIDALARLFKVPVMRFFADPSDDRSMMTPEAAIEVLTEMVRSRNIKQ